MRKQTPQCCYSQLLVKSLSLSAPGGVDLLPPVTSTPSLVCALCPFCRGRCPWAGQDRAGQGSIHLPHFSVALPGPQLSARPLALRLLSILFGVTPSPSSSLTGCLPKANPSACLIFGIWFLYALQISLLLLSCCLGDSTVQLAPGREGGRDLLCCLILQPELGALLLGSVLHSHLQNLTAAVW